MSKLFVYGGGGHGKVVVDSLQDAGHEVIGIIDSKFEGELFGVSRYKEVPPAFEGILSIIAIGDNKVRETISMQSDAQFFTLIHPSSVISKRSTVGAGSMILHRAIIQAGSVVGDHVIINTGAQVDHDCKIGDFVHVAPGAVLCGTVTVGEGTLIGAGAVIKPGVTIGSWVTIGSGAVVVKNIPDNTVVVGNPARVLRTN